MQYAFFVVPVKAADSAAEELNRFLRGHRAVSVAKELIGGAENQAWAFCVEYLERPPIGSLTSQHFANAYLGRLDRFIREEVRESAGVRYMDDFVVWAHDRTALLRVRAGVRDYLRCELRLELKREPCPQRAACGMDFLGCRVFPHAIRLARRSRRRFVRRLRHAELASLFGRLTDAALQVKATALVAAVALADCAAWRRRVFENLEAGHRARIASTAAADGTTTPRTAAPPTATGTIPATATTTSVSVSPSRPSSVEPAGWPEADPVRLPLPPLAV